MKEFVIELSERLADEPDYESYLLPKFHDLIDMVKEDIIMTNTREDNLALLMGLSSLEE